MSSARYRLVDWCISLSRSRTSTVNNLMADASYRDRFFRAPESPVHHSFPGHSQNAYFSSRALNKDCSPENHVTTSLLLHSSCHSPQLPHPPGSEKLPLDFHFTPLHPIFVPVDVMLRHSACVESRIRRRRSVQSLKSCSFNLCRGP